MEKLLEELNNALYLLVISFTGAVVGLATKNQERLYGKTIKQKIVAVVAGIIGAMFAAYITSEVLRPFVESEGLRIAFAGIAAYIGPDMLYQISERLMAKVKEKIDKL